MKQVSFFFLYIYFIKFITSQTCNGTLSSTYLQSSPSAISGISICSTIVNNSCCSSNYYTDSTTAYNTAKQNIITNFNAISSIYASKMQKLSTYRQTYNITYYFQQAFNWTYTDPESNFLVQPYLFQLTDIFNEFNTNFQSTISTFQTCAQTILNHYAGFICSQCNPNYYTQGFMNNASQNLNINLDYSVCAKIESDCFPYIQNRSYFSNIMNVFQVMDVILTNITIFNNYMANQSNTTSRIAFANLFRNTVFDLFEFPIPCNSAYDCIWACQYLVNSNGINITALINPTYLSNYSLSTFQRILTQMNDFKEKEYRLLSSFSQNKNIERNLQVLILITNPSGIIFTTSGWDTMLYGLKNNSGLDSTITLTQYSYPASSSYAKANIINLFAIFIMIIINIFI